MTMAEWINVKDKLPDNDICALVINTKGWMGKVQVVYHKKYDTWVFSDPGGGGGGRETLCIDVTHYIEIPPFPRNDHE